jgi:hypothetical protein
LLAPRSDPIREVFYFPSEGGRLYGSLYAAPGPVRFGIVLIPSIGLEAAQTLDPAHALASAAATWGGAGFVFHPPGTLDSSGDPAALTLNALSHAVIDAAIALRARAPAGGLGLVGFRFGASAATLAAAELDPRTVILLAPVRDPAAAVEAIRRQSARATLGRGSIAEGFGHTLPVALADHGAAGRITGAMAAIADRTVVADFADPPSSNDLPDGTELLVVPGTMTRFRVRWAAHLARAAEPVVRHRMEGLT